MIAVGADLEGLLEVFTAYSRCDRGKDPVRSICGRGERDDSLAERARSAPGGGRVGRSLSYTSVDGFQGVFP